MKKKRTLCVALLATLLSAVLGLAACGGNDEGGKASKTVTSIDLVETSIRCDYVIGEQLDFTGAKLWVAYNDESEELISVTREMVTGFDTSTAGDKSALITYASQKTKYYYRVSAQRPEPDYFETLENADGTLIIESVKENCQETIYLPATLGGKTVKAVSSNAFSNAEASRVVIEEGVETLYKSAFANNEYIDFITLPDSITSIGDFAFWNCSSLEEITFGNGIKVFGNGVLRDCPTLVRVTLPSALETVGTYTFYNCTALDTVDLPATVTNVEAGAFWNCATLKSVSLPNITEIKDNTFKNCYALRGVGIANVTAIGKSAFEGTGFSVLELPKKLTSIGERAFYNVRAESIALPEGLISIGKAAFKNDTFDGGALRELAIPASLKTLGIEAFRGQPKLKSVTIAEPSALTEIPDQAFDGSMMLKSFQITDKITRIGSSAFRWAGNGLNDNKGEEDEKEYFEINLNDAKGLKTIDSGAFENAYLFGVLTIPDSVDFVGSDAFNGTLISELVFTAESALTDADNLANWGVFAANCRNLKKIVFPPVDRFHSYWLDGVITHNGETVLTDIDLSNMRIESMDDTMLSFNDNSRPIVTGITLPKTLKSIGAGTFANTSISRIYYPGTRASWDALTKAAGWDNGLQAGYTVTCAEE